MKNQMEQLNLKIDKALLIDSIKQKEKEMSFYYQQKQEEQELI